MTTPASDPLRDRVVAAVGDRYLIEAELGRGGMAVVYRAMDVRLHRRLALKVLPPELAYHNDVRERFLREAQMAAQLNHPNIVPIYSVDEQGGIVYFAMALVDGDSVAALCRQETRCPPEKVARILREVADALAYAHAHGVVHRDIKPDNILLDRASGRAMVTDFGIARAMSMDHRLTVTGVAMGTPTYMSPEQAMGERDVDGRSDQYSLAVVGYEMLAGGPPFRASNTPALLMKHVSEPPVPIWTLRDGLPPTLAGAITRALAKKPADRWRDAAQFRDAIAGEGAAGAVAAAITLKGQHTGTTPEPSLAEARARYRQGIDPYAGRGGEGYGSLQDRARDAGRAPHQQRRSALERPPAPVGPALPPLNPRPRAPVPAAPPLEPRKSLAREVSEFQKHLWGSGTGILICWAVNLMTLPDLLWAVFPTIGMGMGLMGHASRVRARGVSWRQLIGKEPVPQMTAAEAARLGPGGIAAGLVTPDVLAGPYGVAVKRAAADHLAINEAVAKLSKVERGMIPDVAPTSQALLERVGGLATTLHRLDADVSDTSMESLLERIERARAEPPSPDQERRLLLLERQLATRQELKERREKLKGQLESAQLALENLKYDLLKLRSASAAAGLADVNTATQQARAVSRDIGHAIDAAKEIEKL